MLKKNRARRPAASGSHPRFRHATSRGFTLIELLIVISVLLALGVYKLQSDLRQVHADVANSTATQLRTLMDAANAFSVNHYQEILGLTPIVTTGLTCTGTDLTRRCTATVASLIYDGLLPPGYNNVTAFSGGGTWSISYRELGVSPNYNVEGLVISSIPWTTNGSLLTASADNESIGMTARKVGSDGGGVTANCNGTTLSFCGTGGAFQLTSSDYPSITTYGQVGGRVGTGTSLFNAYLRRDGTLPMLGNLNMGGNSIYNAVDVTGTGNLNMGGTLQTALNSATNTYLINTDSSGRLFTNGYTASSLPTGWTGGVVTYDAWAADTIGVGVDSSGTIPAVLMASSGYDGIDGSTARGVLVSQGSVLTPKINNAGAGVIIGAEKTSSPWGETQGGYNYSANGALSVDDVYIRSIGKWASQVASEYASRGVYIVSNGTVLTKPVCTATGMPTGTARVVVTPGDQVIGAYLQTGPTVSTGVGSITFPSSEAVGEFSDYAVDNGTTWSIHITSTNGTYTGNYGLAHVFCQFPFNTEE